MTVSAGDITLTGDATAVLLAENPDGKDLQYIGRDVVVLITNTSANPVYIGGSSATTDGTNGSGAAASNKGATILTTASQAFVLSPGDKLYGFAHTTSVINVWKNGQA